MIFILGLAPMIWKCQVNFRGLAAVLRSLVKSWYSFLDWCPCFESVMSISGGSAAVLRPLFKRWYSYVDWCPWFEHVRSISGGLQLFLGLSSKDDIHSWTGAHDLKVSGQFQGGLQLFLDLFSKNDIHSWTGAHDLKMSGQFQGACSCS